MLQNTCKKNLANIREIYTNISFEYQRSIFSNVIMWKWTIFFFLLRATRSAIWWLAAARAKRHPLRRLLLTLLNSSTPTPANSNGSNSSNGKAFVLLYLLLTISLFFKTYLTWDYAKNPFFFTHPQVSRNSNSNICYISINFLEIVFFFYKFLGVFSSQGQNDLSLCSAFMDQFKQCKSRYGQ